MYTEKFREAEEDASRAKHLVARPIRLIANR
jgi:hypothetical protein